MINCSICQCAVPMEHQVVVGNRLLCEVCHDRSSHCARCGKDLHGGRGGVRCVPPNGEWFQLCNECFGNGAMDEVIRLDDQGKEVALDREVMNTPITSAEIVEIVDNFSVHQKHKFLLNRHKTHWRAYTHRQLLERLRQELCELQLAIEEGDRKSIVRETADVGNFCAMIADNASRDAAPVSQLVNGGSRDADITESEWCPGDVMMEHKSSGDDVSYTQRLIKGEPPCVVNGWECDCNVFKVEHYCRHVRHCVEVYGTNDPPRG